MVQLIVRTKKPARAYYYELNCRLFNQLLLIFYLILTENNFSAIFLIKIKYSSLLSIHLRKLQSLLLLRGKVLHTHLKTVFHSYKLKISFLSWADFLISIFLGKSRNHGTSLSHYMQNCRRPWGLPFTWVAPWLGSHLPGVAALGPLPFPPPWKFSERSCWGFQGRWAIASLTPQPGACVPGCKRSQRLRRRLPPGGPRWEGGFHLRSWEEAWASLPFGES